MQLNNSCKKGGALLMSQKDSLVERLLSKPKDFTIDELESLMGKCCCKKFNRGRTSGSAIAYIHEAKGES